MRFLVMVKANAESETACPPSEELFRKMGEFNDELTKAGMLIAAEGLQPSAKGVRLQWSGTQPTVIDGPFSETKELVGGFWLLSARSRDEVVAWLSRAPFDDGATVEIRQIAELEEFASLLPPEALARAVERRTAAAAP